MLFTNPHYQSWTNGNGIQSVEIPPQGDVVITVGPATKLRIDLAIGRRKIDNSVRQSASGMTEVQVPRIVSRLALQAVASVGTDQSLEQRNWLNEVVIPKTPEVPKEHILLVP
jgi:hypothetical protein